MTTSANPGFDPTPIAERKLPVDLERRIRETFKDYPSIMANLNGGTFTNMCHEIGHRCNMPQHLDLTNPQFIIESFREHGGQNLLEAANACVQAQEIYKELEAILKTWKASQIQA